MSNSQWSIFVDTLISSHCSQASPHCKCNFVRSDLILLSLDTLHSRLVRGGDIKSWPFANCATAHVQYRIQISKFAMKLMCTHSLLTLYSLCTYSVLPAGDITLWASRGRHPSTVSALLCPAAHLKFNLQNWQFSWRSKRYRGHSHPLYCSERVNITSERAAK